jgi:hypothetical protein
LLPRELETHDDEGMAQEEVTMKGDGFAAAATEVRVTAERALERQRRGEPLLFIDTRNPHVREKSGESIPGSVPIGVGEIAARAASLPRDRAVITWCT